MVRATPLYIDDCDNHPLPTSCSMPLTPSPCYAAAMRLNEELLRSPPARRPKPAPAALNEGFIGATAVWSDVPGTPSPCGTGALTAVGTWQMQLLTQRLSADSVSLGSVEAGTGLTVPAPSSSAKTARAIGMRENQQQPPGIFLPRAQMPLQTRQQATVRPNVPPPPSFPPSLWCEPDVLIQPPAPAHLPQCTSDDDASVIAGTGKCTLTEESGPTQFAQDAQFVDKFTIGCGSRLAKQLAQHLVAEGRGSGLQVRNTFIDSGLHRSPSLERLLLQKSRQVQSCPGSRLSTPQGNKSGAMLGLNEIEALSSTTASTVDASEPWMEDGFDLDKCARITKPMPSLQAAAWRNQVEATDRRSKTVTHLQLDRVLPARSEHQGRRPRVLQLEDALTFVDDEPAIFAGEISVAPSAVLQLTKPPRLGSAELPSVGSLGHHIRRCKPCAFVTRMGCSNGIQCNFCHLCNAGEKKRRRKEKRALLGAARRLAAAEGSEDETSQ